MKMTAAALCGGLVVLVGCSGADEAEVAALSTSFTASSNPLGVPMDEEQATCVAEVYLESDLSDEAIEAIKAGEPPAPKTTEDAEVMRELADEVAEECLGKG